MPTYMIYRVGTNDNFDVRADSDWRAVEKWMEGCTESDFFGTFMVQCEGGEPEDKIHFQVLKSKSGDEDYYAERMDGKRWDKPHLPSNDLSCHGVEEDCRANQTFHIGVSCYGPNASGKFRGAISVDSQTIHNKTYASLDEARQETVGRLLECVTLTLGFSRKDAIEELRKEARHVENTNSDEGTSVDG